MKHLLCIIIATLPVANAAAEPSKGTMLPFKQVSVSSPVLQEVIADVLVKEGDTVKENDVLVQLRNDRERLDVEISLKLIELKRFVARGHRKLFTDRMGSEEKALEAQTDLELSELQMKAKQVALDEKTVRSPLGGFVVKTHKERGESVDRAEKLVDVINIDQVYAQFYLKPELRPVIGENQAVKVQVPDLANAAFEGKISFIDPSNDAKSGFVRVKVLIENAGHRIKAGMNAVAEFGK